MADYQQLHPKSFNTITDMYSMACDLAYNWQTCDTNAQYQHLSIDGSLYDFDYPIDDIISMDLNMVKPTENMPYTVDALPISPNISSKQSAQLGREYFNIDRHAF